MSQQDEKYLSGFKVFLMFLIPTSILAILIILVPYGITHATIFVTPIIFMSVIVFVMILRSKKYLEIFGKMKYFDQLATVITWFVILPVIFVMMSIARIIYLFSEKAFYVTLWIISVVFVFILGIEIKTKGNLPKERFILIYNHTSNIDDTINPIVMGRLPWKVVFEPNAIRILLVKLFLDLIGIPFEREGKPSSKKGTKDAIISYLGINKEVKAKDKKKGNLLIFPEGGRLSPEEKRAGIYVKTFKPRTFKWSQESGISIVPVAVDGPIDILPKRGQWWFSPKTIHIHYLGLIKIGKDEDVKIVAEKVRILISEELKLIEKEKKEKEKEMLMIMNQASRF